MTTEQMNMLTGCSTWEQLIKALAERGHDREQVVTFNRTSEILRRSDDGPDGIVFKLTPINVSVEEIKAKAYDEIMSMVKKPSPVSVPLGAIPSRFA